MNRLSLIMLPGMSICKEPTLFVSYTIIRTSYAKKIFVKAYNRQLSYTLCKRLKFLFKYLIQNKWSKLCFLLFLLFLEHNNKIKKKKQPSTLDFRKKKKKSTSVSLKIQKGEQMYEYGYLYLKYQVNNDKGAQILTCTKSRYVFYFQISIDIM